MNHFCGVRLSTFSIVVGWVNLMGAVFSTILLCVAFVYLDDVVKAVEEHFNESTGDAGLKTAVIITLCFYLTTSVANVIASALLIVGSIKYRKMDSTPNIIKRKYKQRATWTDTADQMLLEMWEDKIPQLRGNRKTQQFYSEIAAELQKNGFSVSALEVRNKIYNLTSRYRKEKLLTGPSGGSPSQWPLYSQLHRFLGSYQYYDNLSDISVDNITASSAEASPSTEAAAASLTEDESIFESTTTAASPLSPASPTPLTSTSKKIKFQNEILKQMTEANRKLEKHLKNMEEMDDKMHKLETKKTDLLDKLVTKQCAVIVELLDYVKSQK